jgi:hypothetical protein
MYSLKVDKSAAVCTKKKKVKEVTAIIKVLLITGS